MSVYHQGRSRRHQPLDHIQRMEPTRRISLVPVASNLCSSLVVVKRSEASSSIPNVRVMVPVVPVSRIYAQTPPSTSHRAPIKASSQSVSRPYAQTPPSTSQRAPITASAQSVSRIYAQTPPSTSHRAPITASSQSVSRPYAQTPPSTSQRGPITACAQSVSRIYAQTPPSTSQRAPITASAQSVSRPYAQTPPSTSQRGPITASAQSVSRIYAQTPPSTSQRAPITASVHSVSRIYARTPPSTSQRAPITASAQSVSRIYAQSPSSTSQTAPFPAFVHNRHQVHSRVLPAAGVSTVGQPQLSLFRTMAYTQHPSEVSLSSLGRPWQMERLWYTRNPSDFQMTDMHLWPPPPLRAMSQRVGRKESARMAHPATLTQIPISDTNCPEGEITGRIKKSQVRSAVVPSPADAIKNRAVVSTVEGDSDDDSSNDDLCLDEGCEMFDEDLEPLDLKVRPSPRSALVPDKVAAFPGSSIFAQHGRGPKVGCVALGPTNTYSRTQNEQKEELYSANGAVDMRMKVLLEVAPSGAEDQRHSVYAPKRTNECMNPKKYDIPERNRSVPIKKQRRYKKTVNKTEMKQTVNKMEMKKTKVMSVRICHKCKCDFRSTMFQKCPLCNASYIVENPSKASNSTLSCLISLPAQLSLSQSNNRVSIVAKIELQPGTILGPLVGRPIDPKLAPTLCKPESIWVTEMATSGITNVLSTENEAESNWLRYVLLGDGHYNTAIITRRSKLFFVTTETISTGQELVLRPYNPLIAHLNSEQNLLCKECQIAYTSPLHLANHRAIVHPRPPRHMAKTNISTTTTTTTNTNTQNKGNNTKSPSPRPEQCPDQVKPLCLSTKKKKGKAKKESPKKKEGVDPKQVDCRKCHQVPPTVQEEVLQHSEKQDPDLNPDPLKCTYCGKVFERRQSFRRHVISHQTKSETLPSRTCKNCGRQFYSSSNLKVHMLTHSGVKPFTCKLGDCAIGFTTKQSLQLHYIKRHGLSYQSMPQIERGVPFTLDGYCHSQIADGQLSPSGPSVAKDDENRSIATSDKDETSRINSNSSGECGSISSVYDHDAVVSPNEGQSLPGIQEQSLPGTQE